MLLCLKQFVPLPTRDVTNKIEYLRIWHLRFMDHFDILRDELHAVHHLKFWTIKHSVKVFLVQ